MLRYYISAIIASAAVIFIANILLIPQASALSVLLFLLLAILEDSRAGDKVSCSRKAL